MKIPNEAKKVFTGEIFDVYQWEQKLYDGSSATFEMLKRPDTTLIIPTANDEIFVVKEEQPRKGPFTGLIGGRVEEGEDPLNGAKRELLEEAGLVSSIWELYRTYMPYTKMDWTIYLYIAKNCEKVREQHLDAGEKIEVISLSFNTFISLLKEQSFLEIQLANEVLRMRPNELDAFKAKLF